MAYTKPDMDRDIILFLGSEPQLKWRTFTSTFLEVCKYFNVSEILLLGAFLANIPHSLDVPVSGLSSTENMQERLSEIDVQGTRYEGPTGIVGVLHDAFSKAKVPSASLWAAVPHYVAATPSPKATLALVERASELLGSSVPTTALEIAAASYERQVSEVVESDEDVSDYVHRLEESSDDGEDDELELPTGDELGAEFERFLREQGD